MAEKPALRPDVGVGEALQAVARYMLSEARAVLDEAWGAGIRYFDAARSYGRAESFLAGWLVTRGIAPEAVVVGSKWGYTYTAGWSVVAEKHVRW